MPSVLVRVPATAAMGTIAGRAALPQDVTPVPATLDLRFVDASGNAEVTPFNLGEAAEPACHYT